MSLRKYRLSVGVEKRAQCNTRYANGEIVREGAQIMLGSNESYVAHLPEALQRRKIMERSWSRK